MADVLNSAGEHPTQIGAGPGGPGTAGLLEAGQVIAGQFEVVRLLGRGGMGVVYEARDRVTGGRLALKTLLPAYARNRKAVDRFLAEVKASRSLKQ